MLQAPFGGVSVWIRQSTSSPDDDKCLHPVTICFFDSKSIMRIDIEYSSAASMPLPSSSQLLVLLTFCNFSSCELKADGCGSASTSTRISMAATAPWTITVSDLSSVQEWQESLCLVCSEGTKQMKLDSIIFIKHKKSIGVC